MGRFHLQEISISLLAYLSTTSASSVFLEEKEEFLAEKQKENTMLIKVKTLSNRDLEITTLEPTNTVAQLKEVVEASEGIPVIQQKMVFSGKPLDDTKSLEECRIKAGDTVHMVISLRAGSSS